MNGWGIYESLPEEDRGAIFISEESGQERPAPRPEEFPLHLRGDYRRLDTGEVRGPLAAGYWYNEGVEYEPVISVSQAR